GDARQDLEEGALPGAVAPDQADDLALLDLERDVLQSPEQVARFAGLLAAAGPRDELHEGLPQRSVAGLRAHPISLAEARGADRELAHAWSFIAGRRTCAPRAGSRGGP